MGNWGERYRRAFETLGRTLTPADAVDFADIAAAERRLGLRSPPALIHFYRVAGRAKDFTSVFNRLLPPADWFVEAGKLNFMEENQAVVLWGTDTADAGEDPPAFQASNEEPLVWEPVNLRCSDFLLVMLHWEAAFGGAMPYLSTAAAPPELVGPLDQGWSFVGEMHGMRAYNRPGMAVCFLRWDAEWRVFAGARDVDGLTAIASDLGIRWEADGAWV